MSKPSEPNEARPESGFWQGREVDGYDRKQRLLIPKKDEILDTIIDFVPFDPDEPIQVVDVGSGPGALSVRVLRHFPRARVTLLDSSAEMLSAAAERLRDYGPRVTLLHRDFNSPSWSDSIGTPDVIVSAIALHFLRPENREPFFRTVHRVLGDHGCFINAGVFLSTDPFVQARSDRRKIEHRQQMLLEQEGRNIPFDALVERDEQEAVKAGISLYSFSDLTRLLRDAGFATVEVVWRYYALGVFVAYQEHRP